MAQKGITFGTYLRPLLVPAPEKGMVKTLTGYSESEEGLGNGGALGYRSSAGHVSYDWSFNARKQSEATNLDLFMDYFKGRYGDLHKLFLYVVDPSEFETNLFSPGWAEPGLLEQGDWKTIFSAGTTTFADVGGTIASRPTRKARFGWTAAAASAVPAGTNDIFTLLIPSDMTLRIAATGVAISGSPVLRAQPVLRGGALAATVDIPLGAEASIPAISTTFSGATYQAVRFYISSTATGAQSLELASLIAQLTNSSYASPVLNGYISGRGQAGMMFKSAPMPQTYSKLGMKALNFSLIEVEPWQFPK